MQGALGQDAPVLSAPCLGTGAVRQVCWRVGSLASGSWGALLHHLDRDTALGWTCGRGGIAILSQFLQWKYWR